MKNASFTTFLVGLNKTPRIPSMHEQRLQPASQNDSLFYDAFKASAIGIAVENLEGQPLFVNPALCSMLGFSEEELRNKHCVDFSPTEDAEKDWALFQQLRAGLIDHYQLDKRYFRRDGSLMWGRLTISLINHRTRPLVLAMVEDITDIRTAQETRFRHAAIVESSDDAIVAKTLDGIVQNWNGGAERMFGYTEEEMLGKLITTIIPPELCDEEADILRRLSSGERIKNYETVRVTKDGKRIDVSLTISPIKDAEGRIIGASKIARDITEKKRAEAAMRKSEERLRLAQQAARIGTFEWNIQTGVNIWTPELEALYGLSPGSFGKTQTAFENLVDPADRARVIRLVDQTLRTGQPTEGEWRVVWPDGSVHWIAGRWQVFKDESGELVTLTGVNIDVTERKMAEEVLASLSGRLIEAQEEERKRIARELHDDVNQRLALLAVSLDHVNQVLRGSPMQAKREIEQASKQVEELAADIQALSHQLHSSKLEHLGLVTSAREFCTELSNRNKVEIDFHSENIPKVLPQQIALALFRVLQEALHNAIKHSGSSRFEVFLSGSSDGIQLIVHDAGIGFGLQEAMKGRGLGLASMKERLRLVKGSLSIDSEAQSGTTIHAQVPVSSEMKSAAVSG